MNHSYDHTCYCTDCCNHEERLTSTLERDTRELQFREARSHKDISWYRLYENLELRLVTDR